MNCPNCGSDNVNQLDLFGEAPGDRTAEAWACSECGEEWGTDLFEDDEENELAELDD